MPLHSFGSHRLHQQRQGSERQLREQPVPAAPTGLQHGATSLHQEPQLRGNGTACQLLLIRLSHKWVQCAELFRAVQVRVCPAISDLSPCFLQWRHH